MKRTLLLFSTLLTLAQADTLRLSECIESALKTHPDIQAWALKTRQAHEGVKAARGAWLPQIAAYAEYDPQRTYVMPQMGTFHTIDDSGWAVGASLTQKVYDFSKTSSRIEASEIQKRITHLSLDEAKALMRYRVRSTYALVVAQEAAIEARRKDLEAKKALYDQARALVAQGLKTRADESRFFSALKGAQAALADTTAAYEKAIITLASLIGRPIAPDTAFEPAVLQSLPAVAGSVEDVARQNLKLAIGQSDEERAEATYRATRAEHFGSIDIVADASHFDTLNRYDTTLLGVRYSLPIYSGGRLSAQEQQAKIAAMVARANLQSAKREVVSEAEGILSDLKALEERIEAMKAQLASAEETRKLIHARYGEGLATYIEVLDAEAVKLEASLGLIEARLAMAQRIYRWEYLHAK
ncbi:TolC family protein [Hydrogenimonas sp.]